jgi:hypothetical protein
MMQCADRLGMFTGKYAPSFIALGQVPLFRISILTWAGRLCRSRSRRTVQYHHGGHRQGCQAARIANTPHSKAVQSFGSDYSRRYWHGTQGCVVHADYAMDYGFVPRTVVHGRTTRWTEYCNDKHVYNICCGYFEFHLNAQQVDDHTSSINHVS